MSFKVQWVNIVALSRDYFVHTNSRVVQDWTSNKINVKLKQWVSLSEKRVNRKRQRPNLTNWLRNHRTVLYHRYQQYMYWMEPTCTVLMSPFRKPEKWYSSTVVDNRAYSNQYFYQSINPNQTMAFWASYLVNTNALKAYRSNGSQRSIKVK